MTIDWKAFGAKPATAVTAKRARKSATQWEKGDAYVGFFVGIDDGESDYGPMQLFVFDDADSDGKPNSKQSEFIFSVGLKASMVDAAPKAGQLCKVTCLGKQGKKAIQFEVATAEVFKS